MNKDIKNVNNQIIELCEKENDLICEIKDKSNDNSYPNDVINNILEQNKELISKISGQMFREFLMCGEVDTEKYIKEIKEIKEK